MYTHPGRTPRLLAHSQAPRPRSARAPPVASQMRQASQDPAVPSQRTVGRSARVGGGALRECWTRRMTPEQPHPSNADRNALRHRRPVPPPSPATSPGATPRRDRGATDTWATEAAGPPQWPCPGYIQRSGPRKNASLRGFTFRIKGGCQLPALFKEALGALRDGRSHGCRQLYNISSSDGGGP